MSARVLCQPVGQPITRPATRTRVTGLLTGHGRVLRVAIVARPSRSSWRPPRCRPTNRRLKRRQKLEQMSEVEKTTLLQKKRRFDDLPAAKQDQLRQLHDELLADPQQQELQRVLERYHNWLRTLTPRERAEVTDSPADKRIEKISELMRAQDAKRFRMMASGFMLDAHDLTIVHDWFDKFIDDHAREILNTLPDEMFGKLKKDYEPERDRGFLRRLYLGPGPPNLPRPSQDDEAQLRTKVSKEARDMLAKVSAEERSQVIQRWMGAAVFSRMRTNPSPEELQAFQESLTQGERTRLESLPRDRMYRELRYLYSQRRFGGSPDRGSPGDAAEAMASTDRREDAGSKGYPARVPEVGHRGVFPGNRPATSRGRRALRPAMDSPHQAPANRPGHPAGSWRAPSLPATGDQGRQRRRQVIRPGRADFQ